MRAASAGEAPPSTRPTNVPGSVTMPTLRVWSIAGTSPVLIAWRTVGASAVRMRSPSESRASIMSSSSCRPSSRRRPVSVVAVIAPPIRMPGGRDRGARRGLEGADRDQDARRADRGHADRGDRPRAGVRDALDAPAAGDAPRWRPSRRRTRSRAASYSKTSAISAPTAASCTIARAAAIRISRLSPSCSRQASPAASATKAMPHATCRTPGAHRRSVASATDSASAWSWVARITARSRLASAATVSRDHAARSRGPGRRSARRAGSRRGRASAPAPSATRARSPPDSAFAERGQERGVEARRRRAPRRARRRRSAVEPVGEVVGDRPRQHHRRLRDQRDAPAQDLRGDARMSVAVEPDRPGLRLRRAGSGSAAACSCPRRTRPRARAPGRAARRMRRR